MPHCLIEIEPWDPAEGIRKTVRLSSADDRRVSGLNDVLWWPSITRLPKLSRGGFDGDFTGSLPLGNAQFEASLTGLAEKDAAAPRYRWTGAPVRIWSGEAGDPWESWQQRFIGVGTGFENKRGVLSIQADVDSRAFDVPVLTSQYLGTGGVEGGYDLKEKLKPAAFGRCRMVTPVLIDAVDNVYQVHGYGAVDGIPAVYERAQSFGPALNDYGSYSALLAANIPAGKWATCKAEGLFRLGAPAYGLITADVNGDAVSGFVRSTADVIQRICDIAGVDSGSINAASLAAFGTAVPAPINLYLTEGDTVMDVVSDLARCCNAMAGLSFTARLEITRFPSLVTATRTLDAQARRMPPVMNNDEASVSPPFWRIEMLADRCWTVHSPDQIAFTAEIIDRGDYNAGEVYREGHVVRQPADGRRYLYQAASAAAGNAPPNSTYWSVYEEAASLRSEVSMPPDVTGFDVQIVDRVAHLGWDIAAGDGLSHYIIKFQPVSTGANWGSALTVLRRVPIAAAGVAVPAQNGTYLIKAVNIEGQESAHATLIATNVLSLDALNVIDTISEGPTFSGLTDGVVVDPTGIMLSGGGNVDLWLNFDAIQNVDTGDFAVGFDVEGWYYFVDGLDLGAVYTSRLTAAIEAAGLDWRSNVDLVPDVDELANFDGADPSLWNAELQVRTSDDGVAFGPWRTFIIGDYTARAFQWRVRLSSSDPYVTPVVEAVSVTIDMPDRTIGAEDVVCPAGGMTVTFTNPFRAIPAVAVTGQNLATGDYPVITAKAANGFNIIFRNAGGTGVERTFDWIAKGYGVQQ